MKDIIVVGLLVIAFAWLLTVHAAIVFGLAKKQPRWRAAAALFVPVLAPYWAWHEHMRARAGMWLGGIVAYLVALLLASR
ncbi:MAG: hypothetical protein KIT84_31495 [Labilithrix sp.]|nr:hypothetical protein [Labilithrix sp.]MCW5815595.1 hypothetical protein [Labilithrix sp.]